MRRGGREDEFDKKSLDGAFFPHGERKHDIRVD